MIQHKTPAASCKTFFFFKKKVFPLGIKTLVKQSTLKLCSFKIILTVNSNYVKYLTNIRQIWCHISHCLNIIVISNFSKQKDTIIIFFL